MFLSPGAVQHPLGWRWQSAEPSVRVGPGATAVPLEAEEAGKSRELPTGPETVLHGGRKDTSAVSPSSASASEDPFLSVPVLGAPGFSKLPVWGGSSLTCASVV